MDEKSFARVRDWVKPAHPAIVKQFEDLIAIYRGIREHFRTIERDILTEIESVLRKYGA